MKHDVDLYDHCSDDPISIPPLQLAIENRYYDVAKEMIKRGADVQSKYFSALAVAIDMSKDENDEFVNYLLGLNKYVDMDAYVTYGDGIATNPLRSAMRNGYYDLFMKLIMRGAWLKHEIAFDDLYGQTVNNQVIAAALIGGNVKILDYIFENEFVLDDKTVKFLGNRLEIDKLPKSSIEYLKNKGVVLKKTDEFTEENEENEE